MCSLCAGGEPTAWISSSFHTRRVLIKMLCALANNTSGSDAGPRRVNTHWSQFAPIIIAIYLLRLELQSYAQIAVFFDFVEARFDGVEELILRERGMRPFLQLKRHRKSNIRLENCFVQNSRRWNPGETHYFFEQNYKQFSHFHWWIDWITNERENNSCFKKFSGSFHNDGCVCASILFNIQCGFSAVYHSVCFSIFFLLSITQCVSRVSEMKMLCRLCWVCRKLFYQSLLSLKIIQLSSIYLFGIVPAVPDTSVPRSQNF